jgi:hypothetical protein
MSPAIAPYIRSEVIVRYTALALIVPALVVALLIPAGWSRPVLGSED